MFHHLHLFFISPEKLKAIIRKKEMKNNWGIMANANTMNISTTLCFKEYGL